MALAVGRSSAGLSVAMLLVVTGVLVAGPAAAGPACSVDAQLTSGDPVAQFASADGDQDRVVFESENDLTGGNADLNFELFLIDRTADTLTQLTNTTGVLFGADRPVIDDSGNRVTFLSKFDHDTGSNPDGSFEQFLLEIDTATFTQISDTTSESIYAGSTISGDGNHVAYASTDNPVGTNADGNAEIFLVDVTTPASPVTTQVSATTTGVNTLQPSVNENGTYVAYSSDANDGGLNADGSNEVYLWRSTGPTTTAITGGVGSGTVRLNAAGTRVTYVSGDDPLGTNADGNFEVFSRFGLNLRQVTDTTGTNPLIPGLVSASGRRIPIGTRADLNGGNGDLNNEVFLRDLDRPGAGQVTHTAAPSSSSAAEMSLDGQHLIFSSSGNLTGENPALDDQLFSAVCGAPTESFTDVADTSVFFDQVEWMLAAGIATGFPDDTYRPKNPTNRQQMAFFMYNLAGRPTFTPPVTPTFSDVATDSPFYAEVEWMVDAGVATGFPDGTYKPRDPTNRQQMANFMYNLAGAPTFSPPGSPTFSDVAPSSVFYDQVEWMAAEGITTGFPDGTFKPRDPTNRQQMAFFMHNFTTCCLVDV